MKIDKSKIKDSFVNLRNYIFMLKFVMKSAPLLMICTIVFDAMTELPWVLSNVVLLKYIIDVIESGTDVYRIFISCGIFAGLVVLGNLGNTIFYEILMPIQKEKLNKKLYEQIYEKAARMDLSAYDDPKFYNDFVLAMNTMGERIEAIIHDSTTLFTNVIAIGTVTSIVASIDPVCLIFVLVCLLMMLPVGRIIAKVNVQRTEAMTPLDRKNLYFSRVFYLQDYAKELRLNPAGEMIERRYNKNTKKANAWGLSTLQMASMSTKEWLNYAYNNQPTGTTSTGDGLYTFDSKNYYYQGKNVSNYLFKKYFNKNPDSFF